MGDSIYHTKLVTILRAGYPLGCSYLPSGLEAWYFIFLFQKNAYVPCIQGLDDMFWLMLLSNNRNQNGINPSVIRYLPQMFHTYHIELEDHPRPSSKSP